MSNVSGKLWAKCRGTDSSKSNFISLPGELAKGQFDSLDGLTTGHAGKIVKKIIETVTCFKVFRQYVHRYSRTSENRRSSQNLRVTGNNRMIILLVHDANYSTTNTCSTIKISHAHCLSYSASSVLSHSLFNRASGAAIAALVKFKESVGLIISLKAALIFSVRSLSIA